MTGNEFLHSYSYLQFPCSHLPFLPIRIPKFKSYSYSDLIPIGLFTFPSHSETQIAKQSTVEQLKNSSTENWTSVSHSSPSPSWGLIPIPIGNPIPTVISSTRLLTRIVGSYQTRRMTSVRKRLTFVNQLKVFDGRLKHTPEEVQRVHVTY